jgi:hypothetical protein
MSDDRHNSTALQIATATFLVPLSVVYFLAGPATYVLLVIRTWESHMSLGWKIVHWFTIDLFLAAFWPALWLWWLLKCVVGYCSATPLGLLFG